VALRSSCCLLLAWKLISTVTIPFGAEQAVQVVSFDHDLLLDLAGR
jgi:hypothetical protein